MEFLGFRFAPGAWNRNEGWHLFSPSTFLLDQVIAFATKEDDGCTIAGLEWDKTERKNFKVHITEISRERIDQKAHYQFYLIYSTKEGKLYKQIIRHNGETQVGVPEELKLH